MTNSAASKASSSTTTSTTNTNTTDIVNLNQRNPGQASTCITDSPWLMLGGYGMYLDGWGQDPDGCGKGILDNLRGQCWGTVERWECWHWGSGVKVTFRIPAGGSGCVTNAVWLASPKDNREEGLCCSYIGPSLIWGGINHCG
ncbi:hypothetical protein DHEL01_v202252 [Diaporthe helianthi]|uniref:Uncharacterized protein n=1 Tax=Diaporthe helianthi TaxID=158607 RepID=A0A2P5IA42_DIAHE|nr:hypothetical protein DHEL01_v202252 [Diaporthe helianthi]